MCPVDDMRWMYAPERLRASDIDAKLIDLCDAEFRSDPGFCYMCEAGADPTLPAVQELTRIVSSYRLISEQMTVTMMQQFYNQSVRPLTRTNWGIDQIRAHITRHLIDHDIQLVSDLRSIIAVDDHLSRHLVQRDADGTWLPAHRSDIAIWIKVKDLKVKLLARLGTATAASAIGGGGTGPGHGNQSSEM
jgi:hypothetical protein